MKVNTFFAVDFDSDYKEQIYPSTHEEAVEIAKKQGGTAYYAVETTDEDGNIENCYLDEESLENAIRQALADGSNDDEARDILLDMMNELNK